MSRKTARVYLSSAIILWLCLPLAGQDKPANPAQIPETTSQETTLRALAQQYLEAYSNRDLNGMMAFWSPTAPEFAMRRQQAQPFFDSTSKITLTQIELQKLVIDGDRADLEVSFELSAVAADTGHQMEGLGKITRSLQCVKQEGLWKIWRDADATYDFAILLLAAKSGEEKSALLSRNVKLVTPYLVDALVDEARKLQFHGEYERALSVHNTAYGIATVISYKRGMARSLNNIGALESSAGKYSVALQTFNEALAIANTLEDKTMVGRVLGSIVTSI
jgi:tetratricopeptide (TPR) repeat protein